MGWFRHADPPGTPAAGALLQYGGIAIRDRDGKLNLTDMWKAAGCDPQKQPAKWRDLPGTKVFAAHVAEVILGKSEDEVFQVDRGGREPATWAHWQLGIAYAKYLSPAFHAWANQVVRDRMEGKLGTIEELVRMVVAQPKKAELWRQTSGIAVASPQSVRGVFRSVPRAAGSVHVVHRCTRCTPDTMSPPQELRG